MASGRSESVSPIYHICSALAALIYTVSEYHYGDINHISQIPQILRALDPSFLSNDFFLAQSALANPRFYYVRFIALISGGSLESAFFLITLCSNVCIGLVTCGLTIFISSSGPA